MEEVADIITSWNTNNELSDEEDEDTMQLVNDVSAINFQVSDDSSNEDSDEKERDTGAAPL